MGEVTITQSLAEIKTIVKRIEEKRQFIYGHAAMPETRKDPFPSEPDGVKGVVARAEQGIGDLELRLMKLRRAILEANLETMVTVNGVRRSIQDWLTWRREVAPERVKFLRHLNQTIQGLRSGYQQRRLGRGRVVPDEVPPQENLIVNVDEMKLAKEIEDMEQTLGELDGVLSLTNATTNITIED